MTRPASTAQVTFVVVAGVAIIAALLTILFALADMGPSAVLIIAFAILVTALVWLFSDLGDRTPSSDGVVVRLPPPPVARVDQRLMILRNGLAYGRPDDAAIERLRSTLVELADDELRAGHGIDRHADPAGAARVMDEDLAAFVDDPAHARRLTSSRYVDHIVTLIERLDPDTAAGGTWTTQNRRPATR